MIRRVTATAVVLGLGLVSIVGPFGGSARTHAGDPDVRPGAAATAAAAGRSGLVPPASLRFAGDDVAEVPDFQRHVLPLMSRLGCNGRACHGSFQGQGGFRLSLFGYDFKTDHDALTGKDAHRVDLETPEISKVLQKPTLEVPHKGGKVVEGDSWAHHILLRWVETGAKGVSTSTAARFDRLEISPAEIVFDGQGKPVPLKVIAHWSDGTAEDVTCLCRFRTNDEAVADVTVDGVVTSKGSGDTAVVAFYDNGVAVAQVLRPVSDRVGPKYPDVPTPTRVDALVVEKLRKLGIVPSAVCDDAEFLRRVRADLTGTLPTPAEVEAFLADRSPSKRSAKIDALLETPEYAAWWATRLCDVSGAGPQQFAGMPNSAEIVRNWYEWLARRLRENTPYDQIVEGIVLATSRLPGQSFDAYAKQESAYYREGDQDDYSGRPTMPYFWARRRGFNTPDEKALGFSYTFLGVRLECAQCHKHPFDQWTQDDFKKFAAFFAPVGFGYAPDARSRAAAMRDELGITERMKQKGFNLQRELAALAREGKTIPWQEVYVNTTSRAAPPRRPNGKGGRPGNAGTTPKLLGGAEVDLSTVADPRQPIMDWMRSKSNPYFARALVNRVWANHFGKGIVNPTDDLSLANPPSNPALLAHLADGFVAHGYDLKWLHREVLNSQTYQRSWRPNETNPLDERNFSRAIVRRLPAEVLIDAVAQVTGSTAELKEQGTPAGLADRAIGPKRGGRRGGPDYAARLFGRSARDTTCDCAASTEPNLLQSIYLQNDGELLAAIERRGGWLDESTGLNAKGTAAARADGERQADQVRKRIRELEAQRDTARAKGRDRQVSDLELQITKRRDDLKQTEARLARLPRSTAGAKPLPAADAIVREAFLRALGRPPAEAETARALGYFHDAPDPAAGLRDLLWALLNTKEFVTNH